MLSYSFYNVVVTDEPISSMVHEYVHMIIENFIPPLNQSNPKRQTYAYAYKSSKRSEQAYS